MLYPAPQAIPAPPLAVAPVQDLMQHFAAVLPWLSDCYGLVQTGVLNDGKSRIPQVYMQDGGLHSVDVYPDERMKALGWFERDGKSTIAWTDGQHLAGTWTHPLAVVVWLNLKRIAPALHHDFTEELLTDFLTRGLLQSPLGSRVTFEEVEQRNAEIFRRYSFPLERQQLLMHPYSGFRVPFTVTQPYNPCAAPFDPNGSSDGPFLIADGQFLLAHR